MRQFALNVLSATVTVLVLLGIAAAAADARFFGVVADDPAKVTTQWRDAGVTVDGWAAYEAWGRDRTIGHKLVGQQTPFITWEPWLDHRRGVGPYTMRAIAAGKHDGYVVRFARGLRAGFYGRTVFLRFAHEMQGRWYPWSADPRAYRKAWRRVWRLLRRHAPRARLVWSPNPKMQAPAEYIALLRRYWPGRRYVHRIGLTAVDFAQRPGAPSPDRFIEDAALLRRTFRRPLWLTEVNVHYGWRGTWLPRFVAQVRVNTWVRGVIWSQAPSLGGPAEMNWNAITDPFAREQMRALRDALR